MDKELTNRRRDTITEEAATWLIELGDADTQGKADFAAWLRSSPEHVQEFLAVATLWGMLPETSANPTIDELVELATSASNVVELSGKSAASRTTIAEQSQRSKHWFRIAAAAAVAAIILGTGIFYAPTPADPNLYTTTIGEVSSVVLEDGSIVTLNTQSVMRVAFTEQYRDIVFERGEGLFEVAKDVDRPFRVITDHAVIQAVGTQFNVRRRENEVAVTVVEGIVDVAATQAGSVVGIGEQVVASDLVISQPVRLTAGKQARAGAGETVVFDAPIENTIAWQERRLIFEAQPLRAVIEEFNRYNDPPMVVDDPRLDSLPPITAIFRSNDPESFVQYVEKTNLAEVHVRPDGSIELRAVESN